MESVRPAGSVRLRAVLSCLREVIDKRARDIAVLGIALNGVECTRIIKERSPGVQIVMLTTFDDDEYILQALGHGAMAKGLTNREIADALFIAEQTVKNHASEIYAKLGVHDRAQALRLVLEAGSE
jgi:DNA-binding NarL/FixJ family response regulator